MISTFECWYKLSIPRYEIAFDRRSCLSFGLDFHRGRGWYSFIILKWCSAVDYPPAAAVAGYCHSVGGQAVAAVSAGPPPILPRVEFRLEFKLEFRLSEGARAPEGMAARWAARSSPPGPPQCTRVVPPTAMAVLEPTTDPDWFIGIHPLQKSAGIEPSVTGSETSSPLPVHQMTIKSGN